MSAGPTPSCFGRTSANGGYDGVMGGRPLLLILLAASLSAQVIEFESAGLRYQALTRNGLTIMCAQLPSHVRDYSILQVAVSNGGTSTYILRPEDFVIRREDGT